MTRISRIEIAGQQQHGGEPFPLALACETGDLDLETMSHWLHTRREELLAAASKHGAVLFRGFPLTTPEDFDAFVAAFDLPNFPYDESLSNAVRVNKTPRVVTANEAPPSVTIFLHHEMAKTPVYRSRL